MLSLAIHDRAGAAYENTRGFLSARPEWDANGTLASGGTPREHRPHWWRLVWISVCAQCFLVALVLDRFVLAGSLLVGCFGGILWQLLNDPPQWEGRRLQSRATVVTLGLTAFMGAFVLLVLVHFGAGDGPGALLGANMPRKELTSSSVHTHYQGVILWTRTPQKARVVPPSPHPRTVAITSFSRPLVIPFRGSYWYFRFPAKRPSSMARIMHGLPTEVAIHSSDFHRLIMEAHQDLERPIDLSCCREIDLKILNADNIPGEIRISLVLTDSSVRGLAPQILGSQPVRSSEPPAFSLSRPPVEETLRFMVPARAGIKRFDELSVVMQPSSERSLGGVKISVQEFRLLPAY